MLRPFHHLKRFWLVMRTRLHLALMVLVLAGGTWSFAGEGMPRLSTKERQVYLEEFRAAIRENTGWERIRAAEALVGHGYPQEATDALRDQADTAPPEERIGVWRTLAQAAPSPEARRTMTDRIREVFADSSAPDRTHAVESMAKLRVKITNAERSLAKAMTSGSSAAAVFPNWLLALSGDAEARGALVSALGDSDPVTRLRAAFSLSHLDDPLTAEEVAALEAAALAEALDAPYRAWMIGAAW